MESIRPRPRTSLMYLCFIAANTLRRYLPTSDALCIRLLSSMYFIVARAEEHARGFPPNVQPWSPFSMQAATFSETIVAPKGTPFAIPFATVTISGRIPEC